MRGDDGYTAAEALAALAILGLAMAGLTTSMTLIGAGQKKARDQLEQATLERVADDRLGRLLAINAPYRSDQSRRLVGGASDFEVDCGAGARCAARLETGHLIVRGADGREAQFSLPHGEAPHFVYLGSYGSSDVWPPRPLPPPAPAWQSLNAVLVQSRVGQKDKPLVVAKIWRQQRADCEYDVVIQDCRGSRS